MSIWDIPAREKTKYASMKQVELNSMIALPSCLLYYVLMKYVPIKYPMKNTDHRRKGKKKPSLFLRMNRYFLFLLL